MLREAKGEAKVFDLPARRFWRGTESVDMSVAIHGRRVANPVGPAAGPHGQMAQNILSSWLAGGRFIEVKTVQVNDRLTIARPCIDMQTVGYNVEWSQELTLAESLREYVKGSMLIDVARAEGLLGQSRRSLSRRAGHRPERRLRPRWRTLAGRAGLDRVDEGRSGSEVEALRGEIPDECRSPAQSSTSARPSPIR